MIIINLSHLFQDEAKLKARAAIKNHLSTQTLEDLIWFKEAWRKREEKAGVTNYSAHVLDRAIMYAQGKKDYSEIEKLVGGFTDPRLNIYNNILHSAQKISMEAVYNAASQFLHAEKIQKRENNLFYRIGKSVLRKIL